MSKLARTAFGGPFECKKEWPDDCFVQCGDQGIVLTPTGSYYTAFFEAFPKTPDTFIRGEGATIDEAEEKCWNTYQKYFECDHPSFEPRDYKNGSGYCTKCGLWFPHVIPPVGKCSICGIPTWHSEDKDGGWWCEEHYDQTPKEKWTPEREWLEDFKTRMKAEDDLSDQEISAALEELLGHIKDGSDA